VLLAIFHIRELHVLNTISNIIGLAVAAGHRLLTRTREQEPMGRPRRTRTREPPGGAQSSPAQDSWPGSSRRETRELEDGWMARTRAHPPRRLAMAGASRRSLKLIVRPAPPLPPEEALSWGRPPAVGMVGPEDPRSKSLQSWRGAGACYGLFPPSPATIVLRPLGRRLIKQSGAPPCRRSSQGVI